MAANHKLTHTIAKRQIDKARRADSTLHLDFRDGSTMQTSLAGPTSSVMVRDKVGKLEYTKLTFIRSFRRKGGYLPFQRV